MSAFFEDDSTFSMSYSYDDEYDDFENDSDFDDDYDYDDDETLDSIVDDKELVESKLNAAKSIEPPTNEFKTSSVSINADGVAISTGGTFTVDSGNFDLDGTGKLYASNAVINGDIYSNGYSVLTSNNFVISKNEPKTTVPANPKALII